MTLRQIIEAIRNEPVRHRLSIPQENVASHLRGNELLLKHLTEFITSRVEDRGALPPPSNPHDAALLLGRDAECREIARLLSLIASLPVAPLAGEEDIGPPDPRALGYPRIRPS